jgi:hypothetical protein
LTADLLQDEVEEKEDDTVERHSDGVGMTPPLDNDAVTTAGARHADVEEIGYEEVDEEIGYEEVDEEVDEELLPGDEVDEELLPGDEVDEELLPGDDQHTDEEKGGAATTTPAPLSLGASLGAMVVDDKAAQHKYCYVVDNKTAEELRTLKLLCRDVHVRLQLIRTQHRHFSMVAEGSDLIARDKQRRRHRLGEGEALEEDQRAALDWEDRMAIRIQTCVRRKVSDTLLIATKHTVE